MPLRRLWPLAVIAAAIALTFAHALDGPYQFDDFDAFVDVAATHSWAAWRADLGHGLRPLLKLSYLVDWRSGGGARRFHVTNLLIHFGNAALLYGLALRMLTRWQPATPQESRRLAALAAALLFALHPAQTEAVTYLSGRSVSLMTLWLLLAVLAYLRERWLLSALAFVAALATKEPAAVLPLLLLLLEACGLGAAAPWRMRLRRLAGFALLPLLLGLWAVVHTRYRDFLLASLGTRGMGDNLLSQLGALRYLGELALLLRAPNIDPDLPEIVHWNPALLATAAALLLALVVAFVAARRRPWLTLAIGWFLIALLPTNSLLPRYDLVNDRQLYLAGIGPLLALAGECNLGLAARAGRRPVLLMGLITALCLLLAWRTALRNRDYASEIALWRATVAASPHKARPYNNLGYAYQLAGCDAQAGASYAQALRLAPAYLRAQDNLLGLQAHPPRDRHCP